MFRAWDERFDDSNAYHGSLEPLQGAKQPKGLSLQLYDYQAKGLAW